MSRHMEQCPVGCRCAACKADEIQQEYARDLAARLNGQDVLSALAAKDAEIVEAQRAINAAAAALRQTCAGCEHYRPEALGPQTESRCVEWYGVPRVPADGTGYCHRFNPKERLP